MKWKFYIDTRIINVAFQWNIVKSAGNNAHWKQIILDFRCFSERNARGKIA